MSHTCKRFQKTGEMRIMAAEMTIERDGQKTTQSMSVDALILRCKECGATQQVDRERVIEKRGYLALKTEVQS